MVTATPAVAMKTMTTLENTRSGLPGKMRRYVMQIDSLHSATGAVKRTWYIHPICDLVRLLGNFPRYAIFDVQ